MVRTTSGLGLRPTPTWPRPGRRPTCARARRRGGPPPDPDLRRLARRHAPGQTGWCRSAPARSCWPRPACSTGAGPPPTGACATTWPRSYPAVDGRSRADLRPGRPIATSAGVTAGIDLALALVEDDLGRERRCRSPASWYVPAPAGRPVAVQRPAPPRWRSGTPLREVQQWIADHPAADLSVEALAGRAGLSPAALRPRVPRRDRQHARPLRRPGPARVRPPPAGGHRRPASSRSPAPAATAPPRRCAAPSSAPSASARPSTAADSARPQPANKANKAPTKEHHADRHPPIRPLYRPRRGRPLPGARPAACCRSHLRWPNGPVPSPTSRHPHPARPTPPSPTSRTPTSSSSPAARARPRRWAPTARSATGSRGRPDHHLDHVGLHRLADPGRGRPARRPPGHDALDGHGRARPARRQADRRARTSSTASTPPRPGSRPASTWR